MAERPSVKEILAAARQGGTARPAEAEKSAPKPPEAKAEAASAATSGRPMTIQEKLAAARGAAKSPAPTASAAPEVLKTPEEGFTSVAAIESVAPEPASGRPLSVKEKLAAARAGGAAAGGVAKVPPTKAAPAPAVEAKTPPKKPAEIREPKALAEALRKKAEIAEKTPAAAIKKVEPESPKSKARRGLIVGGAVAAAMVAGLAWLVKRVASEPRMRLKIGPPSMFKEGSVIESPDWDFRVLRRGDRIVAIRSACTHLGCPTRWSAVESKFLCPCHGSAFDADGINVAGPAPRPLERYKVSIGGDGQVVVDRARTFRKDLGEWDDPASFVTAG